ncbi:MAG: NAD(P)H-dependent oxidoreductase [Chitinophagales bacterium]|nr:NAD(P)H-dependent oxidoreductase [Chitinophagales bacterium]
MKVLAFAASNSSQSINKKFLSYVLTHFQSHDTELLDLNDYDLPLYSIDKEKSIGIPELVSHFSKKLEEADVIIISLAEHNGTYTAVFKNLFDWLSRYKLKMFEGKRMILLATAPGPRGGRGVMDAALVRFPIHGAEILGHFCLPKFQENFDAEKGIINEELKDEFNSLLNKISKTNEA